MITYQVEAYDDCIDEIDTILRELHWDEIATDKDVIKLDKDEGAYKKLADEGQLHIVTARKDGRIIGYHATFVRPHLHYKSTLYGFVDVYYIIPKERNGWVGIKLFKKAEETLKARGVVKLLTGTKAHFDLSELLRYLDYKKHEIIFSKLL